MRELWRSGLDLLLPPSCAACGTGIARDEILCSRCDGFITRIPRAACNRCQSRPTGFASSRCRACEVTPSSLDACVAAAVFEGEVESWIHRFKYPRPGISGLDPAAGAVARMLVAEAAEAAPMPPPDWIVPVPLHPRRLRQRGYNPAALLGRSLARQLGVAFAPVALKRLRDTPSQTGLDRRARRANLRGAFGVGRFHSRFRGSRIWLLDDVVTTGATLASAAKVLRRAGARSVVAICAARTPEPGAEGPGPDTEPGR